LSIELRFGADVEGEEGSGGADVEEGSVLDSVLPATGAL